MADEAGKQLCSVPGSLTLPRKLRTAALHNLIDRTLLARRQLAINLARYGTVSG
jgi:hypothetical protein